MEIVRELREIPNLALAMGVFDGVHIGHQAVIASAVEASQYSGSKTAIVTFKEHPYCYFHGVSPKYILTLEDKYKYVEQLGIDYFIELDFGSVCHMTPDEYLQNVIVKYFSPKIISTGFNHHFGKNKTGNVTFLSKAQEEFGFMYLATPPQMIFGDAISSTAIRGFIQKGVVDMATSMLGRKFEVSGTVIKGKEVGRTLGFPTANIIYPLDIVEPPYGVYDVDVTLDDGSVCRGLANFGISPTIKNDGIPCLEVFLIGFEGNLYDREIRVSFSRMIRPEQKFSNLDELKTQIEFDIQSML